MRSPKSFVIEILFFAFFAFLNLFFFFFFKSLVALTAIKFFLEENGVFVGRICFRILQGFKTFYGIDIIIQKSFISVPFLLFL